MHPSEIAMLFGTAGDAGATRSWANRGKGTSSQANPVLHVMTAFFLHTADVCASSNHTFLKPSRSISWSSCSLALNVIATYRCGSGRPAAAIAGLPFPDRSALFVEHLATPRV